MTKVAIVGASGYTGAELSRILANHPEVEITAVTSRKFAGQPLAEVFPNLRGRIDLTCENLSAKEVSERADVIFTAVPHKTAMDIVPLLLEKNKKIIDLSADYRLRDIETYEKWYDPHNSPEHIKQAVYGLPELYREEVKNTSLAANPGCYPTSIILGIAPLIRNKVIDNTAIIADSKSGTSGAGRAAKVGTLFCEVHDGFKAYGVGGTHRHTPEIEQELGAMAGEQLSVSFTPHLLPISRGILSTIYAPLNDGFNKAAIREFYENAYRDEPFVRFLPENVLPATQHVRGSNYCDINFFIDERTNRVIVVSAIDNVMKGAAGQAVQNMNLMCGFEETLGLEIVPTFP